MPCMSPRGRAAQEPQSPPPPPRPRLSPPRPLHRRWRLRRRQPAAPAPPPGGRGCSAPAGASPALACCPARSTGRTCGLLRLLQFRPRVQGYPSPHLATCHMALDTRGMRRRPAGADLWCAGRRQAVATATCMRVHHRRGAVQQPGAHTHPFSFSALMPPVLAAQACAHRPQRGPDVPHLYRSSSSGYCTGSAFGCSCCMRSTSMSISNASYLQVHAWVGAWVRVPGGGGGTSHHQGEGHGAQEARGGCTELKSTFSISGGPPTDHPAGYLVPTVAHGPHGAACTTSWSCVHWPAICFVMGPGPINP